MGRHKQIFHQRRTLPVDTLALPPGAPEPTSGDAERTVAGGRRAAPVLVAPGDDGRYEVLVGHGRVHAARRLQRRELECVVLEPDCRDAAPVIERLQAGDFDPWELADTLARLKERHGWTQDHLGQAIGRTRDFVTNVLAVCNIGAEVRTLITEHPQGRRLTTRHLRYIGRTAPALQLRVARRILQDELSTKELEFDSRRTREPRAARPLLQVRALRKGSAHPRTQKEWRRYYRQITTDLRRIERKEQEEFKRMEETIRAAKARQRTIRREAREKRRTLQAELRHARRHLDE